MSRLLMIAPAPVIEQADGSLTLDVKFVEGMRLHVTEWGGPVTCVLQRGNSIIPFGGTYQSSELGFDIQIIDRDEPIPLLDLNANDLIFASADMSEVLHLASPAQRPAGTKIVYSIEYTLPTRLCIVSLDSSRSLIRKLRSKLWLLGAERRRRAAFRQCDGIQANGYPAFTAYKNWNSNTILYLDGRMSKAMMATPEEQTARTDYLRSGKPLRLVHSGRLEPLKGAQDLIPLVKSLLNANVNFTFDIFGDGSLAAGISQDIADIGLGHIVKMHGAVDFESMLVPFMRTNADLFVSCHRQSDPSCTYLETLSCGVPIVGYSNIMWKEMVHRSRAGWAVALGDVGALGEAILKVYLSPEIIVKASERGLDFAMNHPFESEFKKRMAQLRAVIQESDS
jgi:colanic acid/amylovoran biosynthesis glycosyltransferase